VIDARDTHGTVNYTSDRPIMDVAESGVCPVPADDVPPESAAQRPGLPTGVVRDAPEVAMCRGE